MTFDEFVKSCFFLFLFKKFLKKGRHVSTCVRLSRLAVVELVTATWLYPQTLSRPQPPIAAEENFGFPFAGPGGRSKRKNRRWAQPPTRGRYTHNKNRLLLLLVVCELLFFLLSLEGQKKKQTERKMLIESVPCFTEYNRYNSVMELDSLSLIFFPYKYIYITLIRIQRVRIHRNSSDEKN